MKIVLRQQVFLKGQLNTFREARKEVDSNVIPHKGDFIADSAFKDPYEHEVVEVVINYSDDICEVSLCSVALETDDISAIDRYLEMYKLHGWEYI